VADDYTIRFNADTSNATSNIKKLTQSIAEFSKQSSPTSSSAAALAKNFSAIEQFSSKSTIAINNQKNALASLNKEAAKAPRRASAPATNEPAASTSRRVTTGVISTGDSLRSLTVISAAQEKVVQTSKPVVNSFEAIQKAAIQNAFGLNESSKAAERLAGRLPTLRYALYDVSNNLLVMSAALTAVSAASFGLAIQYERDFSNVIRTTGATGDAADKLRADFVKLKSEIPVTFQELASIGTLAGQLNVAQKDIADFTKNVAMFAATTDVTAEAAATAFGRLDQLIDGVDGQYEKLASSILAVGVNSVATESQIIAVAQNIASIGNQANLTADQIIGLSGALASVGIQPELARGLTTRLFTEISTAVSQGSVTLENFGRIAGLSGNQFASAWRQDAGVTLVEFLKGLNAEGRNAEASLAQLGITSVRDVPNILKLSQGYEEVGRLLGVASDGFSEAEELQRQYSVITSTVAEKLNLLVQNFQMFIAASGSGVTILGGFLDILNNVLASLTQFASTPFGGAFLTTTNIIVGLVGILGLLVATVLRATASFVAFKTTQIEAGIASGIFAKGTTAADVSLKSLTGSLFTAAGATRIFNTVLKASIIGLAISAGVAIITAAIDAMSEAMKTASDRATEMFGSLDGLEQALEADAQAIAMGEAAIGSFTSAIDGSTSAIGRNTAELIANTLQNDENFKKILENAEKIKQAGGPILDAPKFIALYAKGDTDAALAIYEEYLAKVRDFNPNAGMTGTAMDNSTTGNILAPQVEYEFMPNTTADLDAARQAAENVKVALSEAAGETTVFDAVMEELGYSTNYTAEEMKDYNAILTEYKQAVNDAFGETNVLSSFSNDFTQLIEGIQEGGNSFSSFSEAGRTNLTNLQSSIASTIAASKSLGVDASEAIALQFLELQKAGVNTAALLRSLAGMKIPGVDVNAVSQFMNGTKQMSTAGQGLAGTFQRMGQNAKVANKEIGKTAQRVVTLVDYANDLSTVFKRAFDIRFDSGQALDKITKGFRRIAEETADARQEIQDINNSINKLNADIQGLTADRAIQEYFLTIAEAYGDALRAQEIRANLAEIDAELIDKTQELTKRNFSLQKAQDKTNKTLVGSSDAAIENRAEITGLVADYQDYIKALAASGLNQEQLRIATARAKADFIAQATQLGYNEVELQAYAAAFDDVTVAINNVPRNVTVTTNTNPALQALNEFAAKARAAIASAGGSVKVSASVDEEAVRRAGQRASFLEQYAYWNTQANPNNAPGKTAGYYMRAGQLAASFWGRASALNYYSGGYTGAGGKYEPAGIVHRGEYVVPKEQVNQRTQMPYFMEQPRSFAQGGFVGGGGGGAVSMMVELSPYDRKLLAQAGNIQLRLDGKVVAQNTNANNAVAAQRGSN
jgi:TP901 family phage tail tape measure protein